MFTYIFLNLDDEDHLDFYIQKKHTKNKRIINATSNPHIHSYINKHTHTYTQIIYKLYKIPTKCLFGFICVHYCVSSVNRGKK